MNIIEQIESATKPAFNDTVSTIKADFDYRVNDDGLEDTIVSYAYQAVRMLVLFITRFLIPAILITVFLLIQAGKSLAKFTTFAYTSYQNSGIQEYVKTKLT